MFEHFVSIVHQSTNWPFLSYDIIEQGKLTFEITLYRQEESI